VDSTLLENASKTILRFAASTSTAIRTISLLTLALVAAQVRGSDAGHISCPNIVFILADDMGYGDVQALNPDSQIPTPNLNRLAAQGMTFTDAHTPSAVCTPTRYGLLTGRYCWRSPLKQGVLNGYSPPLIERERPTVASQLASAGYRCGVVGKWHLGLDFAKQQDGDQIDFEAPVSDGPNELGFASSYIIPASLDFPPYVYIRNGRVTATRTIEQAAQPFPAFLRQGPRGEDLQMEDVLDNLLGEAVGFIRREAATDEPFFLYFPLTAPHKPVLPHPRFRGRTDLGPYGDFIVQVDWTVGQVLQALDACGVAENTLIIFTSDNGSYMYREEDPAAADHVTDETIQAYRVAHHTSNGPLRGTKADVWEGGHRVPFFARWPSKIARGSRCEQTICLTDFFATASEMAAVQLPEDGAEDSFSFLPALLQAGTDLQRPPVIHHSAAGMFAIRDGRWKLVLGNGSGGREQPKGKPFERPYRLFDFATDLAEQHDVLPENAEIADRLEQQCNAIQERGRSR
jgi:arylsulfatase A-like enzyme